MVGGYGTRMKTIEPPQNRISAPGAPADKNDIKRLCAVVALGVVMYLGASAFERTFMSHWVTQKLATETTAANGLSQKKTCIMRAWQAQSGVQVADFDRAGCARYLPQQSGSARALASN